jgi:hypothetical protein
VFTYDNEWTEQDWRHEADARELAELDADRRDMQEYPAPALQMKLLLEPPCCENPANFKLSPGYDGDWETGYPESMYYRCQVCNELIAEEDYAALVQWEELQRVREMPKNPRKAA